MAEGTPIHVTRGGGRVRIDMFGPDIGGFRGGRAEKGVIRDYNVRNVGWVGE